MERMAWTFGICMSLYLAIMLIKYILSLHVIKRDRFLGRSENFAEASEITIVQAILGGDPNLRDILRSTLENTSEETPLLWMLDADDDQGLAVTQALAVQYPQRVRIIICDKPPDNVNPKVFKLQKALTEVKTEYLVVLDDDTMISNQNLTTDIAALKESDLYTGLPGYLSTEHRWDSLVAHFVNNNSIMTYLPILPLTGPLTINGMFYVMRTKTISDLGDFSSIRHKLCDDYAMARKIIDNRGSIHQGIVPQYLYTSISGFYHYIQIMHRWFVFANALVRDQRFGIQLVLLILFGSPPLLLWAGLFSAMGLFGSSISKAQWYVVPAIACGMGMTLALRQGMIRWMQRKIFDDRMGFSPITSLLAELLQPLHWTHALVRPTINWRTRRMRVYRDNSFKEKQG